MNETRGVERRLIGAAAVGLAFYNALLVMFPAPITELGEFRHVVPAELIRGSRFVLLTAAVTLLLVAPGLWQGKRSAWLVALAAGGASALAYPVKNINLWGIGGSLVFIGVLMGSRPEFSNPNDPPAVRKVVMTLVVGLGLVFIYAVVGLYFLDYEFRHSITLGGAVRDGLRLMFVVPTIESEPATRHAKGFIATIRVAILFVWFVGVSRLVQPLVRRRRGTAAESDSPVGQA